MITGTFIVFDGLDNTGKTTQSKQLVSWLQQQGLPAIWTCEPFASPIGNLIRRAVKEQTLDAQTKALLFLALRTEHLQQVILPALQKGMWVVCDRYIASTLTYQGEMGVDVNTMLQTHRIWHHDIPIEHLFLFTGRIQSHREQDAMDAYCDAHRQSLEARFAEIPTYQLAKQHTAIHVDEHTGVEQVFERILHALQKNR